MNCGNCDNNASGCFCIKHERPTNPSDTGCPDFEEE